MNLLETVMNHWESTLEGGILYSAKELTEFEKRLTGKNCIFILPSDHCYNRVNGGYNENWFQQSSVNMTSPMFVYMGRSKYAYLGRDYPYTGKVVHAKTKQILAIWDNGKIKAAGTYKKVVINGQEELVMVFEKET